MLKRWLIPSLFLVVTPFVAADDGPESGPAFMPDPLRAASLPFDLPAPATLEPGRWSVTAGAAWFNTWSTVWELTRIHREAGYDASTSPTSAEFRELEARVPDRADQHIDLEGHLIDLRVERGFNGGWTAGVRLPWISIGGPHWDGFIDQWHHWFGLTTSNREYFRRSDTLLYVQGHDGVLERRNLDGSGPGDLSLFIATPDLDAIGGRHRAVVALEAPTGETDTLRGSGGWDLGARLHSHWRWTRTALWTALGVNRLDPDGDLLGIERADTWYGGLGARVRIGKRWRIHGSASYEASPLADFTDGEAGEAALWRTLGVAVRLNPRWMVEFGYGTNRDGIGIAPDASFRLGVVYAP